jgi:hypothetical protein
VRELAPDAEASVLVADRFPNYRIWGGHSGHTYTFTQRPDGKTEIDNVVVREGKNLKGKFLGVVLGSVGKRVLSKAFDDSVKAIETRNAAETVERC